MGGRKPFSLSLKAVVLDDRGRCLVLKRSGLSKTNPGRWDFPGGKVDPGEGIEEALNREVLEETGLEVDLTSVAGSAGSETPTRKVAYLIIEGTVRSGALRLSEEHDDYAWVAPDRLRSIDVCPQFRQFANRYGETH